MNPDTRFPTPRTIFTLLILSQMVFAGVHQISHGLLAGLLEPLVRLLLGPANSGVRIGPIDLSLLFGGLLSGVLTLVVGIFVTLLVLKFTWRFIAPVLSETANKGDA